MVIGHARLAAHESIQRTLRLRTLHRRQCLPAIKAKKQVLCEKLFIFLWW
jgi:hypothetical protein